MSAVLRKGHIVMYKPTRQIFAWSSGSWTGNPADKRRPCIIVQKKENGIINVAPLCGALQIDPNTFGRRPNMSEWWHPVLFKVKDGKITIPVPNDSLGRLAINIDHDPSATKLQGFPRPKPCYIWAGDEGEAVDEDVAKDLQPAYPYVNVNDDELRTLETCWRFWAEHDAPAKHEGRPSRDNQ